MDMSFLKYMPSDSELKELVSPYFEVWQGLPEVQFSESESRGGRIGLVYEGAEGYVWISPAALAEYRKNPSTVSIAVVNSTSDKRLDVEGLMPQRSTLEGVIRRVRRFNEEEIKENRKKAKKKSPAKK